MPTTDPRVDAYIEKAPEFAKPMLKRIRKAFHQGCPDVAETIKWSTPAFEHHGLLGSMAAFKKHVSYGFWRGKELDDPEGLFEGVGDASMCAHKPSALSELPNQKTIADYVRRAAAHNRDLAAAGPERAKQKKKAARPAPRTPPDLAKALKAVPAAAAAFDAFPPSHKREYVEWITEAKRDATREKRIRTAVEWIAEGKSRNWKYQRRG